MTPVLYSFRRCPYAIRARLAIAKSGVSVELREVLLRDKPRELLDASPKGTVPVLALPGDTVIDESLDIMLWALQQNDPDNWLLQEGKYQVKSPDQWQTRHQQMYRWISDNDTQFKPLLDRYKYADRFPAFSKLHYRQECENYLGNIETSLINNDFLMGEQLTIADIAIFPFIRQFAFVDKAWFDKSAYQRSKRWLDDLLSSDCFNQSMVKCRPWKAGHQPLLFPG